MAPQWVQLQLHTDGHFLLYLPVDYCPALLLEGKSYGCFLELVFLPS